MPTNRSILRLIALLAAAAACPLSGRAAEPPATIRRELGQAFAGGLPVRPVSPVFIDLHPLATRLMRLQIPLAPDASQAERAARRGEIARAAAELGVEVPAAVADCYVDNACARQPTGYAPERRDAPARGPLTRAQLNAILQSAVRASDALRDGRGDPLPAPVGTTFWSAGALASPVELRLPKGLPLREPPSPELHRRLLAARLEPVHGDLPLANVPATYLSEGFLQTRREYERLNGRPMPKEIAENVLLQVRELAYGRKDSPINESILEAQRKQMRELREEFREMVIPGYACYSTYDSWSERGAWQKGFGGGACALSVFPLASRLFRATGSAATTITASAAARDLAVIEVRNADQAVRSLQSVHWAVMDTRGLDLDLPALSRAFDQVSTKAATGRVPIDIPGFAPYQGVNKAELSGRNLEQVKEWAESVLRTAQSAFPGEKLRIVRIDLGKGWNANQSLVHVDQTGTYLHGLVTLKGESTIVYLPGANAPAQGSVLAGRAGEDLLVKHFPVDGGITAAIPSSKYVQPPAGQTVLITGVDRRRVVAGALPTKHSSPLPGSVPADRLTLFIDIKPEP